MQAVPSSCGSVAKASLYSTFGSKDELVRAYLTGRHERRRERITRRLAACGNPRDRLLAVFDLLGESFAAPGFHGCAFANASAESAPGSAAEQATGEYRGWMRNFFTGLAREAGAADPAGLARQFMLLYDGANMSARMDGEPPAVAVATRDAAATLPARPPPGESCRGPPVSELEGRGAAWIEERGTSGEGRRHPKAPRKRAGDTESHRLTARACPWGLRARARCANRGNSVVCERVRSSRRRLPRLPPESSWPSAARTSQAGTAAPASCAENGGGSSFPAAEDRRPDRHTADLAVRMDGGCKNGPQVFSAGAQDSTHRLASAAGRYPPFG